MISDSLAVPVDNKLGNLDGNAADFKSILAQNFPVYKSRYEGDPHWLEGGPPKSLGRTRFLQYIGDFKTVNLLPSAGTYIGIQTEVSLVAAYIEIKTGVSVARNAHEVTLFPHLNKNIKPFTDKPIELMVTSKDKPLATLAVRHNTLEKEPYFLDTKFEQDTALIFTLEDKPYIYMDYFPNESSGVLTIVSSRF
jgi:hypothetical protein